MHNTAPGFTKNAFIPVRQPLVWSNNRSDGAGTITAINVAMYRLLTADVVNGSFLDFVRFLFVSTSTAQSITSPANVARIYLSSIITGGTLPADTQPIAEVALPLTSGNSPTIAQNPIDVPFGLRIPAGMTVLVSLAGQPTAGTAWVATAFGGDF